METCLRVLILSDKQVGHENQSIISMLPKNYRFNFDFVFAQSHNNLPRQNNIIEIPINFSFIKPKQIYKPQKKLIGIVIGKDSTVFQMKTETLKKQLDFIKNHFCDYGTAITLSPGTIKKNEKLAESYELEYNVIFSKNRANLIPNFLSIYKYIFITIDSTSMISKAISYYDFFIEVLPIDEKKDNKFYKMAQTLENNGFIHIFDGRISKLNKKINFREYTKKVLF